jgi:hypothetical protein
MDPAFQKDFLRDFKRGSAAPVLALFGKHPAWNDHMDDFGLTTPSLRTCKRLLYLQGIAANAARQQGEAVPVMPYRHFLLWFRGKEALLIRLVESEDGRGRGYFPLVAALHFEMAAPDAMLRRVLPGLRAFVDETRALGSREAVSGRHRHAQAQLAAELHQAGEASHAATEGTEEAAAFREVTATAAFAVRQVPVSRYDHAEALAVAAAAGAGAGSDQALLIALNDAGSALTLAAGEPEKGDFWFLRSS